MSFANKEKRFDEDGDELTPHGYWVAEHADIFAEKLKAGQPYSEVREWWENEGHPETNMHDVLVEISSRGLNPNKRDKKIEQKTRREKYVPPTSPAVSSARVMTKEMSTSSFDREEEKRQRWKDRVQRLRDLNISVADVKKIDLTPGGRGNTK